MWEQRDISGLTSAEQIEAADLPEGLHSYLIDTLTAQILANEPYVEEFPDCPVTVEISAVHPAGFAVGQVMGCGPDGVMGIFKDDGGTWRDAVGVLETVPECTLLAQEGVPAGVPVPWDEGLRCAEPDGGWRYW